MGAVITAAVSGGLLLAFVGLLHLESRRGGRVVLSGARAALDRLVVSLHRSFIRLQVHLGTGAMRIAFLRTIQRIIEVLLRCNEFVATHLYRLLQRNRRTVRTVRRSQEKTYMDILADHQAESMLTDDERSELKRRSIEGE